ncbi:LacI family DNA-binding transcriptional regulator [Alloscardovia venturai]
MAVTLKQIADSAGVSTATVSRFMNADPSLSITQKTREKIIKAIEDLGYDKQPRAISIPRNIALLDTTEPTDLVQDEYFDTVRESVAEFSRTHNLTLTTFTTLKDILKNAKKVDGFIGIGPRTLTDRELTRLHSALPHGVFIDTNPAPHLFDSVQPDLQQTIVDAIDILTRSGKKKIAFIGGDDASPDTHHRKELRSRTFIEYATSCGLDITNLVYDKGPFCVETGKTLTEQLIANHKEAMPDAIIVAADSLAVGVLQSLAAAHIAVPHDVAVVSINNMPIAQYMSVPLTTYDIDIHELTNMAVTLLTQAISRKRERTAHAHIGTKLVVRSSFVPERI